MPETNGKQMPSAEKRKKAPRVYESETMPLESLRLIAAPKPEDDLTEDQMIAYCKEKRFSAEMIHTLINFVKSI